MIDLFKVPAYVYVYVNKQSGEPVYVGKVNAGSSLESRISDHRSDFWYEQGNLLIYYTPVESSATADILETALINSFLEEGYVLYNIAKTTWGSTSLVSKDRFGWILYEENNARMIQHHQRQLENLEALISLRRKELSDLTLELEIKSDPNYDFLMDDDWDAEWGNE